MTDSDAFAPAKTISERVWYRFLVCILTLAILTFAALYGALAVVCYGPSPTARDIYVLTVMNSNAPEFMARAFFSEEKVQEILTMNREKQ